MPTRRSTPSDYPAWQVAAPNPPEALGFIPLWLRLSDPRPIREQLHEHYAHGGGWRPFKGFKLVRPADNPDPLSWTLAYEGDPPVRAIGTALLRNERIVLFRHSWVAIVHPSGEFEVARMD